MSCNPLETFISIFWASQLSRKSLVILKLVELPFVMERFTYVKQHETIFTVQLCVHAGKYMNYIINPLPLILLTYLFSSHPSNHTQLQIKIRSCTQLAKLVKMTLFWKYSEMMMIKCFSLPLKHACFVYIYKRHHILHMVSILCIWFENVPALNKVLQL